LQGENDVDDWYPYSKNYITIIEPENFQFNLPDGGSVDELFAPAIDGLLWDQNRKLVISLGGVQDLKGALPFLEQLKFPIVGTSIVQNGKVYDPADVRIENKFGGVTPTDPLPVGFTFEDLPESVFPLQYAGNRQPKEPVPPGDDAFFLHGICTATSGISTLDVQQVTSHTCKLNLCLGGGGFDCIAILAGSAFVFDAGRATDIRSIVGQFNFGELDESDKQGNILPPPYPGTIIGGTGAFEGIEGTINIATVAGTTGVQVPAGGPSAGAIPPIGKIVQTISVKANMPLPSAP
jgi:hypothetical protein